MAASVAALQAHSPDILWLSSYDAGYAGLTIVPGTPDRASEILDYSGNGCTGTTWGAASPEMAGAYTTHFGTAEFPICTPLVRHRYLRSPDYVLNNVTLTYMGPMTPTLDNTGSEIQITHTGLSIPSLFWRWGAASVRQLWWATSPGFATAVTELPDATSWPSGVLADEDAVVIYGVSRRAVDGFTVEYILLAAYGDSNGLIATYDETVTAPLGIQTDHSGLTNDGNHAAGMTMVAYRAMTRAELVETLIEMAEFHGAAFAADVTAAFPTVLESYACACEEAEQGFRVVLEFGGLVEEFRGVSGVVSETLDMFEVYTGDRSMPIAVTPLVIDVPALVLAGHSLEDATVRVYRGEDLVMLGRPESPRWGRFGEAVRFTVREDPWEDRTVFPAGWDQRVTVSDPAAIAQLEAGLSGIPISSAYGYDPQIGGDDRYRVDVPPYVSALGLTLYVDVVEGRAGPIVFGAPGYQDGETWPATPAYWIVTTEGDEQLMIARHRVAAANVTIFGRCVDGEVRGKVCPVSHALTPAGITVAVAEITAGVAVRPKLLIDASYVALFSYSVDYDITYIPGLLPGAAGVTFSETLNWGAGANYAAMATALGVALANRFPQAVSIERSDADPVVSFVVVLPIAYDLDVTATSANVTATTQNTGVTIAGNEDFDVDFTAEWQVAWHDGEGLPGGAGDVIRYVLDQTRIRLDRGRLESHRVHLNSYQLAGYLDEQVVAIEWLAAQLRVLPISWVAGREGLFAWLYDPETLAVPVATLTEGETISIDGDAGLTSRDPVRRVDLAYRSRADVADTSLVTSQETIYSRLSTGEIEALSTDVIDATATAERAAALRQRALSRRYPVITGTVARDLDWLRAGDPVQLSAPSWGLVGGALVTEVTDPGGPRVGVTLTMLT